VHRSKPAVPIGGKYRLIDIPVSNCLNSDLRRIYVLTQYNSESLNKHLGLTYKFDVFTRGFVQVLAAEQTEDSPDWFQGTADAVRQSLRHLAAHRAKEILILSGDQLYQMDYRRMAETHRRNVAEATVAVTPVTAEQAPSFGILKVNRQGRIVQFEEKPGPDRLEDLASEVPGLGHTWLASMGIYLFNRPALERAMADASLVDFGRHVIPQAVPRIRVQAHVHRGYWEDVGTIRSYYLANLALCQPVPPSTSTRLRGPVYSQPRFLPATKVEQCQVKKCPPLRGVHRGGVGDRAGRGRHPQPGGGGLPNPRQPDPGRGLLRDARGDGAGRSDGIPPVGIGEDSVIEKAIVDKNARIGRGVRNRQRGGGHGTGRPGLPHPRRDRGRDEERGDPRQRRDLSAGPAPTPCAGPRWGSRATRSAPARSTPPARWR
jgi:glucose-1-phosphate adenylyltransferase